MQRRAVAMFSFALLSMMPFASALAADAELGGSMASMRRQHEVARQNDYTFLRTAAQVREFVREDRLQPLVSNEHLVVNNVSFPYARPAVKLFVERLAEQYHSATGQRLVVTSLTRPMTRQPRNAHELSVHPAGMAVDLRVPSGPARVWLEFTLLQLEKRGVLDATLERRPPHYHVAVFPDRYSEYVQKLMGDDTPRPAEDAAAPAGETDSVPASLDPAVEVDSTVSVVDEHPVLEQSRASATVPLIATLGIGVVAIAGTIRRRMRRNREERRARHRVPQES